MLKKRYSFLVAFLLVLFSSVAKAELPKVEVAVVDTAVKSYIRLTFYSGVQDEAKAVELLEYIQKNFSIDYSKYPPIVLAYYGAAETLLGKHAFNPINKLKHLNSGLEKLAFAIAQNPRSLEIRFMRFSILHYIPFFLGRGSERDDDLETVYQLILEKNYSEIDKKTQLGIISFLIESDRLSSKKNDILKNMLGL